MFKINADASPEDAQKLIDEEICRLKSLRNTYAHISKLPEEILLKIFRPEYFHLHLQSLGILMMVSRHWRCLLIGAPTLWTRPPTASHDLTLMMLERSKMADLSIKITRYTADNTIMSILGHAEHIRILDVWMDDAVKEATWNALQTMEQRALRLETLVLNVDSELAPSQQLLLPLHRFSRKLERLRNLTVRGIDFDWFKVLPMPLLTSLDIFHSDLVDKISLKHLLDTLAQMPMLECLELSLDSILGPDTPGTLCPIAISLNKLSYLRASSSSSAHIQNFLSHISIPSLRMLEIEFYDGDNNDYTAALGQISSSMNIHNFGGRQALKVSDTWLICLPLDEISTRRNLDEFFTPMKILDISVPRRSGLFTNQSPLIVQMMAVIPNKQLIERAHLSECEYLKNAPFLSFIANLPNLQTLEVEYPQSLLNLLIDHLRIPDNHPPTILIPFPRLRAIHWVNAIIYDVEEILDCLRLRQKYGAPILEMTFEKCKISEEDLGLLQEINVGFMLL